MSATVVIYRPSGRDKYALEAIGSIEDIRVGDLVSYWDPVSAHATGKIDRINEKAGNLRLAPVYFGSHLLRPARRITFKDILKAERPVGPEGDALIPEVAVTPPVGGVPKKWDKRIPPPGSLLERDFYGRLIQVEVLDDGQFEYRNKVYKKLDKIATEVVGKPTNGYIFFRL